MIKKRRYIYAIGSTFKTNEPVLLRAKVIAAGPIRVMTNATSLAFGCRSKHDADGVHWTPDAAWDAFGDDQRQRIESSKQQIVRAERSLELASVKRLVEPVDDSPAWGG